MHTVISLAAGATATPFVGARSCSTDGSDRAVGGTGTSADAGSAARALQSWREIVQRGQNPLTDGDESASRRAADASERPLPGGDVTVDDMSEASFPASDPPATWTWEVRATRADAGGSHGS
jgi:hypothetical protein